MKKERKAGILLHISSLPSKYGIGSLGKEAFDFIDFIAEAGFKVWQILPLVPTSYGDSPYQTFSSGALNHDFIDIVALYNEGLLTAEELEREEASNKGFTDYERLFYTRSDLLRKAFLRFDRENKEFKALVKSGEYYDYALFMALKRAHGFLPWEEWEEKYRDYYSPAVSAFAKENGEEILFRQFTQYLFLKQWKKLKDYAISKNIEIMGDMPLYVAYDSVGCWKHPELFLLDERKKPTAVAGVPPDAFSADGQLWGNPLYNWEKMAEDGYKWWKNRINNALEFFDILRLDHFRGFDRYFSIPPTDENAKNGRWIDGPKDYFFKDLKDLPIVAEDLGIIDDGVRILRKNTGFPGMKVLEFAFDGREDNEYLPSRIDSENSVAYTGTHDNMPLMGYFDEIDFESMKSEIKKECDRQNIPYETDFSREQTAETIIRLTFLSKSFLAVVPMQDFLFKGKEARMNLPSTLSKDNWSYRALKSNFTPDLLEKMKNMIAEFDR